MREVVSKIIVLPSSIEQNRLVDVPQLATLLGFSVAHLRRLYRTGQIPSPIRIGGRKLGWPAHVVIEMTSPNRGKTPCP